MTPEPFHAACAISFRERPARPLIGLRGRMHDVVCQIVGIGMIPQYVMEVNGVEVTGLHEMLNGGAITSIISIIRIITVGLI